MFRPEVPTVPHMAVNGCFFIFGMVRELHTVVVSTSTEYIGIVHCLRNTCTAVHGYYILSFELKILYQMHPIHSPNLCMSRENTNTHR